MTVGASRMPRKLSGAAGETVVASRRVRMTPSARVRQIAQVPSPIKQFAIDWICVVVLARAGERRPSLATGLRCELRMSQVAFLFGDFALLVTIGAEAAVGMHVAHEFIPGVLTSTIVGMVLGMGAGMLTALVVRPVLGSIETAVPTMIGGMIAGLTVCLVIVVVGQISTAISVGLGAATGIVLFSMLRVFGLACRRRFEQHQWRP